MPELVADESLRRPSLKARFVVCPVTVMTEAGFSDVTGPSALGEFIVAHQLVASGACSQIGLQCCLPA